jgi:DNA adenine methylase
MTINNKNNISPLRYPGGKTRACKILDQILNKYFDLNVFDIILSPFFGGGSFEFHLQNTYNKKIANDKFTLLYNFWKQIKNDKMKLYRELENIKDVKKEDFQEYRNIIMDLNEYMLEQAKLYFIINRCSFSGATLSGGFSEEASKKRFTNSSKDKIKNLDLTDFEIYNWDFEKFINNQYIENKTLIFLDPPYYLEDKSNLYGKNGDLHGEFDHKKLYDLIKNKKNWIITYNDCEYIRKLYSEFIILSVNWTYSMNKSKKSSEIVIINNK